MYTRGLYADKTGFIFNHRQGALYSIRSVTHSLNHACDLFILALTLQNSSVLKIYNTQNSCFYVFYGGYLFFLKDLVLYCILSPYFYACLFFPSLLISLPLLDNLSFFCCISFTFFIAFLIHYFFIYVNLIPGPTLLSFSLVFILSL